MVGNKRAAAWLKPVCRTLVGTAVAVLILFWCFRTVGFRAVLSACGSVRYGRAAFVSLLTVLSLAVRSIRWRAIIRPYKDISGWSVFRTYGIGMFFNALLPFKIGDVIRSHALGRSTNVSRTAVFSTVVMEWLFEGGSLLCVVLLLSAAFAFPRVFTDNAVYVGGVVAVASLVAYTLVHNRHRIISGVSRITARFSGRAAAGVADRLHAVVDGLNALESLNAITQIFILSFLAWGVQLAMIMVMASSMDIALGTVPAAIVLAVINIGIMVPVTPGNVGVFQALCILALGWFGVPKADAFGFAVVFQLLQFVPIVGLGMFFSVNSGRLPVRRRQRGLDG